MQHLREYFEIFLTVLFLISTITYVIYRFSFYKNIKADLRANKDRLASISRKERRQLQYNIVDNNLNTLGRKVIYFFADLFWLVLFIFILRAFLYEPFIIPSGSMKPGLQVGDAILVNKFERGLRLPITNQRITEGKAIMRGDVIVFKYPVDKKTPYIKRVIGLPGDKISYDGRDLLINEQQVNKEFVEQNKQVVPGNDEMETAFDILEENLFGVNHSIQHIKALDNRRQPREWIVPEGKYLMFGDNRDGSSDGRMWGYVDDKFIIGRAKRIALNLKCFIGDGHCDRFFKAIQ